MSHTASFERAYSALYSALVVGAKETEWGVAVGEWVEDYGKANLEEDGALQWFTLSEGDLVAASVRAWSDAASATDAQRIRKHAIAYAVAWYEEHLASLRTIAMRAPSLDRLAVDLGRLQAQAGGDLGGAIDLSALPVYGPAPEDLGPAIAWDETRILRIDGEEITIEDRGKL